MPNYPYTFQLPPLNVQDIPNDGVAGEFLGINGSGVLDWLTAGGGGTGDMLKADNLSGLASYPTARTNLGLGTGDSPTFANLTLTSPSLVSSAPVTISQTWNGTGSTVFKALVVNATTPGTTSSTSSLLLDLQVGGVSQFSIQRNGTLRMPSADPETKLSYSAAGFLFYGSGSPSLFIGQDGTGNGNAVMGNTGFIGFASAFTAASGNADTRLYRDAANTLALRNGAGVPQAFRVYNTFLGTTANEWFEIDWKTTAGLLKIGTTSGGTGVGRPIELNASGSYINFNIGTIVKFAVASTSNLSYQDFKFNSHNSHDIGASGANSPRNVYVGTSLFTGIGGINFDINARLRSPATDVITLYNNGLSDFNRLQFGGTTDAFPAIARDGAGIKFTGAAAGSTSWIKVPPVAVGSLPVAATAGAGARAFVNDASAPVFGTAVAGGGAVLVPVYCTGSAWNVG